MLSFILTAFALQRNPQQVLNNPFYTKSIDFTSDYCKTVGQKEKNFGR